MDALRQLGTDLWRFLPYAIGGIAVLVVGLLLAWIAAGVARKLVARTRMDDCIGTAMGQQPGKAGQLADWVASAVFWIILALAVIGALSVLQLSPLSDALRQPVDAILRFVPQLVAAGVLLLVAWITAGVLRVIVIRTLGKVNLERRLGITGPPSTTSAEREPANAAATPGKPQSAPVAPRDIAATIGDLAYWLVFLLFLPAILGTLALEGILGPVQGMVNKVLAFLPNILAAGLILGLGWFFAAILRKIVIGVLAALGVDRLGTRIGLQAQAGHSGSISHIAGWTVFLLVLIPVFLAALDAVQMQALTAPTSQMLGHMLQVIPNLAAAILVLAIAYAVGRIVGQLVTRILESARFDALPAKLGLGTTAAAPAWSPSRLAGHLVLIAILLFATLTSLQLLGFTIFAGIVTDLVYLAGRVVLGLAIFGLGLFLADIVARTILSRQKEHTRAWALAARTAILFLAGAVALRQMGLADEIITLAFGLTFGALAVAAAIAFGIGGREFAGRKLQEWETRFCSRQEDSRGST